MTVSAHVLDGTRGGVITGVGVQLDRLSDVGWEPVAAGQTDAGGRFGHFESGGLTVGTYRWVFAVGEYFTARGIDCFYPEIPVVFAVTDAAEKYHIPIVLSPFSYATYRGY